MMLLKMQLGKYVTAALVPVCGMGANFFALSLMEPYSHLMTWSNLHLPNRSVISTADHLYEILIPSLNDKTLATTVYENMDEKDPLYGPWLSTPYCMCWRWESAFGVYAYMHIVCVRTEPSGSESVFPCYKREKKKIEKQQCVYRY